MAATLAWELCLSPLGACWALSACLPRLHCLQRSTNVLSYVVLTMLECWLGKGVIILIGWMRKHMPRDTLCPIQSYTRMCPTEDQIGLVP